MSGINTYFQDYPLRGLYAITPDWQDTDRLAHAVTAAITGGARLVQYRNKIADAHLQQTQAFALQSICAANDVPLIINDNILLAKTVGAAGVHLGQSDESPLKAREMLGKYAIIGVTCHNQILLAEAAVNNGASYLAFGRIYPSHTKPFAPPAPLSLLQHAKQAFSLPITAIGGITFERAPEIISHGADMIAIIEGLFAQPDIALAARRLSQLFEGVNTCPT